MAQLTPWLVQKFYESDGVTPAVGHKIFTYEPGTSTKKATKVSASGSNNANPVITNANGEPDSGGIWLEGAYKIVQAPANDTDPPASPIKTWDDVGQDATDGNFGIVDTYAELKALAEGEFEVVQILGFGSVSDKASGYYRWDATSALADNGLTIVQPTVSDGTGRWIRIYLEDYKPASITELKALPAGGLSYVEVGGYYTVGDGGGGLFYWNSSSTAADNGGTIVIPDSSPATGRWFRIYTDYVDVKEFGAKGDNSTDDIAKIQAALDAVKTVRLSIGNFVITTSITLNTGNTFFGENDDQCNLVVALGAGGGGFIMVSALAKNDWTVKGIGFDNSANYPDNTTNANNENVYLNDEFTFDANAGVVANQGCNDWRVEACRFTGITNHGVRAVEHDSAYHRVRVVNNTFTNGSYFGKCIDINGKSDGTNNSTQIIVSGNISNDNSVSRYVLPGIRTQNASAEAIQLDHCENFVVTNNNINKCAGIGIRIEECLNGTVDGNSVYDAGQHGIMIYNSSFNVVVSNNSITKWGRIPDFGNLRWYSGAAYIARETPVSGTVNLPADPSASSWFDANIYYSPIALANLPAGSIPTYSTGNYYDGGTAFTSLGDGGDPTNDSNFTSAHNQGILPFRGFAGINVSALSEKIIVEGNTITGDLTQTGGLYNYASDFGISIVHNGNAPVDQDNPMIARNNIIRNVINTEIYQPSHVDPINERGVLDAVFKYPGNYKVNANDELVEIEYDYDSPTFDNIKYSKSIPKITLATASNAYIKVDPSSRPTIGTAEFGLLMQYKVTSALDGTTRYSFDSGEGGATTAGFQIYHINNTIIFRITDGASASSITYTDVTNWGVSPNDVVTLYCTRDSSGIRMTVIIDNNITKRHIPEISGTGGGAYDVDSTAGMGIAVASNVAANTIDMELYRCIIWAGTDMSFTNAQILDRLNRKRLIRTSDLVVFDLNTRSQGQFFIDNSETSKIIWGTPAGMTSSEPSEGAFANWQSNTSGSEWVTGVDQKCLPDDFVITHIIAETTGTPTIQVGSTGGGAELVSSVALSAAKNNLTVVTPFSSTSKISVTSDDTSVIQWSFLGYRARY